MARVATLPARTLGEVHAAYPVYRQSLLGTADNCLLSARFDIEGKPYTNAAQARGILFHAYAREILRVLKRTGQVRIPSAEALEILYEVCAQRDVPDDEIVVVGARERRMLRLCAIIFAGLKLDMTKLVDEERRLFAKVTYQSEEMHDCPDCLEGDSGCDTCQDWRLVAGPGTVTRDVSGQPDALLSDPPNGAVVIDWKTAPSAPADGDQPHWTGDHLHVSYEGYWQQRFYALLVMRNYPSVQQVTLREYYVLEKEGNRTRNATVPREALEHIEREIAEAAQLLDRALMGGSKSQVWQPAPGKHCDYCRRPSSCPIEGQARVKEGGIVSDAEAARVAAEYVLVDQVRESHRAALKTRHEATERPIPVKAAKGRFELRWGQNSKGGRRFGLYVPEASDRGAEDPALKDAFREAKARKAAA